MPVIKKIVLIIFPALFVLQLQAQKLELWYTQPAVKWTEALPLGNGRIGAMVFGGVQQDHIQFNEETLWTGSPRDYNKQGAYKYLDSIRALLFAGKQKEAESLAELEFMGTKSEAGNQAEWLKNMLKDNNYAAENFDDRNWKNMYVPSYNGWEAVGFEGLDGAVWLRKTFVLPEKWAGKNLQLDLNKIRDRDLTYVNGKLIGSQQNDEARNYIIPAEILHAGLNSIAVLVINYFDKGGITGYKDTTRHIAVYPTGSIGDNISLNGNWKYFIQNSEPPAVGVYQASYQPFGDLYLNFANTQNVTDYKRSLNLENAVATTTYSSNNIVYTRQYFVSQPAQAAIVHLAANKKASINFTAALASVHKNFTVKKIDDSTIALYVQVRNGALHGDSYLRVTTVDGSVSIQGDSVRIKDATEATLVLTAATNFINYKNVAGDAKAACTKVLQAVKAKNFSVLLRAHTLEYSKWFSTFAINFGADIYKDVPTNERLNGFSKINDPAFAALYMQYGRYLLISASRPGTGAANLQGIWNDLLVPPWGSKYTTNINAEMNYWPAELLNLSAMHEPLFSMIKELDEAGKETAKQYYNADGWVVHHNTDIWRGTAPINAANHGIWVGGGGWLCQHLWEHYAYTQDENFLRKTAYPLMKRSALFYAGFLVKDPSTGFLISTPSNSPEQGGLVAGPTMDHQIIRTLFKHVIEAAKRLKTDAAFAAMLQQKKDSIAPNKIGRYGQLQEWMQDIDDTTNKHRHISHLWGVYPGNEINWDADSGMMQAAKQSLIYRGDVATGWSLGWKINCWARFKDAGHAYNLITMLLSPATGGAGSYPNLFDAHPPFQIDGNFGGAAGIAELLLQSHAGYIDVLPALPKQLHTGSVQGLCARGGFVIDMDWDAGMLAKIVVHSNAAMPLQLHYNNNTVKISTHKNGIYTFNAQLQQQ